MGQDVEEYVFYEKRKLEEEIKPLEKNEQKELLLGERSAANKRKTRLQEEVTKLEAFIALIKEMENAING